jgi:hypothetical protein
MSETVRWLMFMYQVPSEPSWLRTAVWRRLKALGAVYAAHSVAVLPDYDDVDLEKNAQETLQEAVSGVLGDSAPVTLRVVQGHPAGDRAGIQVPETRNVGHGLCSRRLLPAGGAVSDQALALSGLPDQDVGPDGEAEARGKEEVGFPCGEVDDQQVRQCMPR